MTQGTQELGETPWTLLSWLFSSLSLGRLSLSIYICHVSRRYLRASTMFPYQVVSKVGPKAGNCYSRSHNV
jgi:hypothetical protein